MKHCSIVLLVFVILLSFSFTVGKASLVAHWRLDGDAKDSVGGHDGVPQGNPEFIGNGKIGGAVVLNGNGDYIQTDLIDDLQTAEDFAIAAWFKTNVTDEGQQHILWIGDVAGNGWGAQEELLS